MDMQNILSSFTNNANGQAPGASAQQGGLSAMIPGGLLGGAAAGSVVALLMGGKSTRKMAKKVVQYGGTAVLGGLAYKAYGNWQKNKALGQTQAVTDQEIQQLSQFRAQQAQSTQIQAPHSSIDLVLIKAMIAASKSDGHIDAAEQQRLFDAIGKLNLNDQDKAAVFDLMTREISVQEIAHAVVLDEHKAEVYLSAYLAIEVDNQQERNYLNNLAGALNLPRGFPAYLEQQADQGVTV